MVFAFGREEVGEEAGDDDEDQPDYYAGAGGWGKVSMGGGGGGEEVLGRTHLPFLFRGRGIYGLGEGKLSLVIWDVGMVDVCEVMHWPHNFSVAL